MRNFTELEALNEKLLKSHEVRFVTVVLTGNILSHHIFDANQAINTFLKNEQVHDFDAQKNGEKSYVITHLLTFKEEIVINSSVYKTSRGDKRMWFGAEILSCTSPDDMYLIFAKHGELYILNMSHIDIKLCVTTELDNPIKRFFKDVLMSN